MKNINQGAKKVRRTIKCPDCKIRVQKLKNHRGNRTCSARKNSKIMLRKGYGHIYAYMATLRRLGVKVISETDARTCIHIGSVANTYYYGWTNKRAAIIVNRVRGIPYLLSHDRFNIIKRCLTDDELFSKLKRIKFDCPDNWKLQRKIALTFTVSIQKRLWDPTDKRHHFVTVNPNGMIKPCCELPTTDFIALSTVEAFGLSIPICVKMVLDAPPDLLLRTVEVP